MFINLKVYSQDLELKLSSRNINNLVILNKIDYQKKHIDSTSLKIEILKVSKYLQTIGYFTNSIDSLIKSDKNFTAYFTLNNKTNYAGIKVLSDENRSFITSIKKLQDKLNLLTKELEIEGKLFSKLQLKNIKIRKDTLFADLEIYQSKKRQIDKVIVKGYEKFPKSFIKHYLNLKKDLIFNQKRINKISEDLKSLKFASEIKPPEVLFTKDSTLLYVYLKKQQNNSFEGLISFNSKENGDVFFNGNIDLNLENILDSGEKFELFWNSIGEERQEFKIASTIPYIFNSSFSPEMSFSIYKQDSTFLNTKLNTNINYNLNKRIFLGLNYSSEVSEKTNNNSLTDIDSYSNYFIGLNFNYSKPLNDIFYNNKIHIIINPSFGNRKSGNNSSNQFKLKTAATYLWSLNDRNNIYIRNEIGYLNSDNYLINELFRIGGINSIRGFDEQSIYTNSYTFFNIEYRYLTSEKSFLYSITDYGQSNEENFLGIGIGYSFTTNSSTINIGSVIGRNNNNPISFKNTKILLNWKSNF
ncbi:BamA/TamA family outer membrane protein [uncultured Polaribacter sp.]|uniref:BamA/TamA family outer membrane protein n=1 Tax=uncultured Polaribacter sp. TaxID=174711 RepID=UPI0026348CCF|nr:BamA/TamA family outer membrane protein [uncultured Polaribacter sp.]